MTSLSILKLQSKQNETRLVFKCIEMEKNKELDLQLDFQPTSSTYKSDKRLQLLNRRFYVDPFMPDQATRSLLR